MSDFVQAAKAELAALEQRRRALIQLLDAYGHDLDRQVRDAMKVSMTAEPPRPAPQPAKPSLPGTPPATKRHSDAKNRAAKLAILQHLRANPQSPRMLKSLTQLSDHRFRVAVTELEAEGKIHAEGKTTERRWHLTGEQGPA